MSSRFILLVPITPECFSLDHWSEVKEAVQEFGCELLLSENITGDITGFITGPSVAAMNRICTDVELEGTLLEYTSVFDQLVKVI